MPNFDGCNLHIPHKEWVQEAGDNKQLAERYERENWSELERWANQRLPNCGGCACFFQHKSFNVSMDLNTFFTIPLTTGVTVGSRAGWHDNRTSMLVVNWIVNISDYSDDTTAPAPMIRYGYGFNVTQQNSWIGGSHGFIDYDHTIENPWQANISTYPSGPQYPDAFTSGSFTTFLNQKIAGPFPNRWDFVLSGFLGIYNPQTIPPVFASVQGDTYEYGMCGCNAQE